jgi:hypothetical protein
MKMSPRLQFEITLHGFLLWASMGFLMPIGILAILDYQTEKKIQGGLEFYSMFIQFFRQVYLN